MTGAQLDFNSFAHLYERVLVPAWFESWAHQLVTYAGIRRGEHVLDVACGTGLTSRAAAAAGASVVGVDGNESMLGYGRAVSEGIDLRPGDAGELPFPDNAFDAVLCQAGFMYFDDRERAAAEMHRVLKPSGRVALLVWGPIERSPGYARLAEFFEQQLGDPQGAAAIRAPFAYDDASQLSSPLQAVGFEQVEMTQMEGRIRFGSVREMLDLEVAGTPLAEPDQEARYLQLLQRVKPVLAPWSDGDAVDFPVTAYLAKAVNL